MKKNIKELVDILIDKDSSNVDKYKANFVLKRKLSYYNINYLGNVKVMEKYIKSLNDIDKYLYDSEISISIKKYIIKYYYNVQDSVDLLKKDIDDELKRYIVIDKIDGTKIIDLLKNDFVSDEYKRLGINRSINAYNIIDVMLDKKIDNRCREYILRFKKSLFLMVLYRMSKKRLIYILTFRCNSYNDVEFIMKYRTNLLNNISNVLTEEYIKASFCKSRRNIKLMNMVFDNSEDKIFKIINRVRGKDIFNWLRISNLPQEYVDIIINNNIGYLCHYIDNLNIKEIINKLNNSTNLHNRIKKIIIKRRFDELVNLLNNYNYVKYLSFINDYYYTDELIYKTIDKHFSDEIIIDELRFDCIYNRILFDFILRYKNDFLMDIIKNIKWNNLFNNINISDNYLDIITSFPVSVQNDIYKRNEKEIMNILREIDKNKLLEYIDSTSDNRNVKWHNFDISIRLFILKLFGSEKSNFEYYKILMNYCNKGNVIELFDKINLFLNSNNISCKVYFQYSSYAFKEGLFDKIIAIISDNEINNFIMVKDYLFNNYFDVIFNDASSVIMFNEIIFNYYLYKDLFMNMAVNNVILSDRDKNNLRLLFKGKINCSSCNVSDLDISRKMMLNKYKNVILTSNVSCTDIKKIFFNDIISFDDSVFKSIGDISSLRILQRDNMDNKEIYYLTEEIITSMDLFNKISNMNDKTELIKIVLSYIEDKTTSINDMIDNIINIKSKIRKLYELDSMYNLTTMDAAREINGIYNDEYMGLYGGEVFDFSDKNYVLYAHIMSNSEKIGDLVNGISTGNSNFISFTPISYRGQKYYYDFSDCILAYDKILDNSFICSSLTNMSSNILINKNSAIVKENERNQRGILETSSVTQKNAESLFYREGLKPCGIILVNGKMPTDREIRYHKKYNLPFIITQGMECAIESPKIVFESSKGKNIDLKKIADIKSIKRYIDSNLVIKKENDIYTGREIAIFTDVHAMYEPVVAILEDIRYRGINEIYSLGDNTSVGPNPKEVLDLLDKYNVKQIMGNDEYYLTLGSMPFTYFDEERERSLNWTYDKVGEYIDNLKLYKPSLDVLIGDKKVALCHFANDIRWDYTYRNTFTYQGDFGNSSNQFMYTNSEKYKEEIEYMINKYGIDNPRVRGYLSSKKDPLFGGKMINSYDDVFEGHVHFELSDKLYNTNIHTLRGAGMGEKDESRKSMAYYLILKERKDGNFDIDKVFVPFNKRSLLSSIYASDMPSKGKVLEYLK